MLRGVECVLGSLRTLNREFNDASGAVPTGLDFCRACKITSMGEWMTVWSRNHFEMMLKWDLGGRCIFFDTFYK